MAPDEGNNEFMDMCAGRLMNTCAKKGKQDIVLKMIHILGGALY